MAAAGAGTIVTAGQFNGLLRAGATPLHLDPFAEAPQSRTQVAGPSYFNRGRLDYGPNAVWAAPIYGVTEIDGGAGADVDVEGGGIVVGAERRIAKTRHGLFALGGALGYQNMDLGNTRAGGVRVPDAGSFDLWSAGVYSTWLNRRLRADFAASYSLADINLTRLSSELPTADSERGPDADSTDIDFEIAFAALGDTRRGLVIGPLLRAGATWGDIDELRPAPRIVDSGVEGDAFQQYSLGAGVRLGYNNLNLRGPDTRFALDVAYERTFEDDAFTIRNAGGAEVMSTSQLVSDDNSLRIGGVAAIELYNVIDLGLRYGGRFGNDVREHTASLRAAARF